MILQMIAHGVAEHFGIAFFKNIYQPFMRYKSFKMCLLFQQSAFVWCYSFCGGGILSKYFLAVSKV